MLHLHIGVQLKISCFVANSKVALGHLGFGGVKSHLITGEPTLVANNTGSVNGGAGKVKVNIAAQVDILALVGSFDFAALFPVDVNLPVSWRAGSLKSITMDLNLNFICVRTS